VSTPLIYRGWWHPNVTQGALLHPRAKWGSGLNPPALSEEGAGIPPQKVGVGGFEPTRFCTCGQESNPLPTYSTHG